MIDGAVVSNDCPGRSMKPVLTLLTFVLNILVATGTCAADADDEDKGVLGGSPPIYAGLPVTGTTQTYRSNRYVPVDRPARSQGLQLGNRCATKLGIFGPGPKMPVGEVCAGMDVNGRPVRGQVVADGSGKFCATSQGKFGPGLEQPIGLPCRVETKTGLIQGRISGANQ
jgi:hypothetical protein